MGPSGSTASSDGPKRSVSPRAPFPPLPPLPPLPPPLGSCGAGRLALSEALASQTAEWPKRPEGPPPLLVARRLAAAEEAAEADAEGLELTLGLMTLGVTWVQDDVTRSYTLNLQAHTQSVLK